MNASVLGFLALLVLVQLCDSVVRAPPMTTGLGRDQLIQQYFRYGYEYTVSLWKTCSLRVNFTIN